MSRRSSSLSAPGRDLYQSVTDRIVASVEADPADPVMPWHRAGLATLIPTNAATGNDYRGINVVALWAEAQLRGFPNAVWASYRQWASLGAQVRQGERGSIVTFYKELTVGAGPERAEEPASEEERDGRRLVIKSSHVFNAAQVDGYTPAEPPPPLPPIERNARAEAFVAATCARIEIGGDSAYYRPATDSIRMPDESRFREAETALRSADWYCVLGHELGHWSGASHRLDRQLGTRFGDAAYCVEELVGELTSAFVVTRLGITPQPREDHARYIAHYLRLMRSDNRAIFAAAAKASEAADYLFAFSEPPERDGEQARKGEVA